MLTWHTYRTLCSPSPVHHIHLAFLYYTLWFPAYESTIIESFEMSPNLLSGLTPEIPLQINLQITPRPDAEASHKTYLRCQPRHIMWGLNSKLSIRLFMALTKIIEFIFHFKFSCWAVLPWGAHSLCAHSTGVPKNNMALAPCIKFS